MGERAEALEMGLDAEAEAEKVQDALADAMVFSSDYCSAMGWDLGTLWDAAMTYPTGPPIGLTAALGRVAHAHLKAAQGIRAGENHEAAGRQGMIYLLAHFHDRANFDLVAETHKVWQKVKLRDWKKDPVNAGET